MWSFILPVFLLASVVSGETNCEMNVFDFCETPKIFFGIPLSVEEYNAHCPEMKNYMKCMKDYQDTCDTDSTFFETQEIYDGTYSAYSELCEEGSPFYKAVTENLRCFNETFENSLCHEETADFIEEFKVPIDEEMKNHATYSLPIEIMCL
ncbi:uncharacterized protein CEXT_431801 [Caerostris extrusa]|uniref:Uncharacterized protein n=1 Tax=Caerostris extrusa TaxID=172846 RepID=A0AAV4T1D6_CAEEX|nr:uncharacterized protein CEXT_431801 [Caerostris extrusa]